MQHIIEQHIIELAVLVLLVFLQLRYYRQASKIFNVFQNIFRNASYAAAQKKEVAWVDTKTSRLVSVGALGKNCAEGTLVIYRSSREKAEVFDKIMSDVNSYILNCKNSSPDFHLMKDIVERQCDRYEEEAEAIIPFPLYCGLAGTIFGIIFGLGGIGLSEGGFSGFVNNPGASIGALLSGIAFAMIVSFLGLLFTTLLSIKHKNVKAEVDTQKNKFYNWLQYSVMPNMAGDLPSAVNQLREYLGSFNYQLDHNVKKMSGVFGDATKAFEQQKDILNAIQQMDVAKMAHYNMKVLERFEESINHVDQFNKVFDTLKSAAEHIDDHQKNIRSIADASSQINENIVRFIEEVDKHIAEATNSVNGVMQKQQEAIIRALENNDDQMSKTFQERHRKLVEAFTDYQAMAKEFKELPGIKKSLDALAKQMVEQNKALLALVSNVKAGRNEGAKTVIAGEGQGAARGPVWQKYVTWGLLALVAVAVVFVGITNVFMINKMNEPSRMLPVDTTMVAPADSISGDTTMAVPADSFSKGTSLSADKAKMETPSQSSGANEVSSKAKGEEKPSTAKTRHSSRKPHLKGKR